MFLKEHMCINFWNQIPAFRGAKKAASDFYRCCPALNLLCRNFYRDAVSFAF